MAREALGFRGGGAGSGLRQTGGTQSWHPKENASSFSLFSPPLVNSEDVYLQLLMWL